MCKANDKLFLFSYILGRFVEIHREMTVSNGNAMPSKEILQSFSNTRIMKLLYCLCLESLTNLEEPQGENIRINQNNLFEFFGAFSALPNGPVLLHIYNALDIIPGFRYEEGHFQEQMLETQCLIPPKYRDRYEKIIHLIDNAVLGLQQNMKKELFMDRDKLVDLTHNLPLWKETFMYEANKEMSTTLQDLQREYEQYVLLRSAM